MVIKPSLRLAWLLLLSHVIVSAVVFATMMPLSAKLVMQILILLSLFYYLARDALLFFLDAWGEISFEKDSISVINRGGSNFIGQIASSSTVSPYFVVLRVKLQGHRLPVFRTFFPDALETGAFRELCVYLKYVQ